MMHEKERASITKNRRAFFLQFGGVATALAVPLPTEPSEIKWSGWREPVSQPIVFGFWYIRRPGGLLVSTTLGQVFHVAEGEELDLSLAPGVKFVDMDAPESVRAAAQERAKVALVQAIEHHAAS